jgi:predicted nucleic acid-binding protein
MGHVMVLDASVLIAYLDSDDRHHAAAETLLAREIDDDVAVNPLTLAEVLIGPTRQGRLDAALSVLAALEIQTLEVPAEAAVRLARLRATTGLKMPGCCVLLSADEETARVASFDKSLADEAENRGLIVLRR